MDGQQALNALMAHPRTFLKKNPLRIAGSNQPSGVYNFAIWNAGTMFRITSDVMLAGPNNFVFPAHSIFMEQSTVAPIQLHSIPTAAPPNILVTGALSGCSIILEDGPNPGDVQAAHLQPNGETAVQLETRIAPNYQHVYGMTRYDHTAPTLSGPKSDRTVTIVGVRVNGAWKIYAQKLDLMHNYAVKSVNRIYPPD